MTAAYALTAAPDWQERYSITLYQMGWRLGGKGASGRNAQHGQRIEEHGLHVWMGFYNRAFRMIRDCYAALGRPQNAPLHDWTEAFQPHDTVILSEFVHGHWVQWPLTLPRNSGVPGDGQGLPSVFEYVQMGLQWLLEAFIGPRHEEALERLFQEHRAAAPHRGFVARLLDRFHRAEDQELHRFCSWLAEHLQAAHEHARAPAPQHDRLLALLDAFRRRVAAAMERLIEQHDATRRLWILLDLGVTALRGILADGLASRGLTAADDEDFRAWLDRHGASDITLASAPVREIYDLCFAYRGGDLQQPDMAAGTALDCAFRIAGAYRGAAMWKMLGGMGDTIFAPMYELLARRGVRFEFFHAVTRLELEADRSSVAAIHLDRQVRLKDQAYRPLVDVKGLPCWPSVPRYEQIVEGETLRARGINLESRWSGWEPVERRVLRAGQDFDQVVLGISIGGVAEMTQELAAANPRWRAMLERVGTVCTQAAQLWLQPAMPELGQKTPGVIGGTYAEPLDTWADMSELLAREDWPAGGPQSILYLCGPMPDASAPPSDTAFPGRVLSGVRQTANLWLQSNAGGILPRGGSAGNPAGLDSSKLTGGTLDAQYLRGNVDPSERYVLSLSGSTRHRLPAGGSGFRNLFLAGDWVLTDLNAGCVEAAVSAGQDAASALRRSLDLP